MRAWELARQWQQENQMAPFEEVVGWHFAHGVVHSTPEVFCLTHPATWCAISRSLVGGEPNAWFVTLAAATSGQSFIPDLMRMVPRPYPWIVWYRQARHRPHNLHAYRWDHLSRRVGCFRSAPIPSS